MESLLILNVQESLCILQFMNCLTSGFNAGVSAFVEKNSTLFCHDEHGSQQSLYMYKLFPNC